MCIYKWKWGGTRQWLDQYLAWPYDPSLICCYDDGSISSFRYEWTMTTEAKKQTHMHAIMQCKGKTTICLMATVQVDGKKSGLSSPSIAMTMM